MVECCFPVSFRGVDVSEDPHGLECFELVSEVEAADASLLDGCVGGVCFNPSAGFFRVGGGGCRAALYVCYDRGYSWRGGGLRMSRSILPSGTGSNGSLRLYGRPSRVKRTVSPAL